MTVFWINGIPMDAERVRKFTDLLKALPVKVNEKKRNTYFSTYFLRFSQKKTQR
jgi:hypothetical protein